MIDLGGEFTMSPYLSPAETGEADFKPSMYYERLVLYFENEVLKTASWNYPQEIKGIANPAVELMDFEQIKESIRKRLEYGLSWCEGRDNGDNVFCVSEITLSYLPSGKKNDTREYYWSPMWAIESDMIYSLAPAPMQRYVFFINAVDGTFVQFKL